MYVEKVTHHFAGCRRFRTLSLLLLLLITLVPGQNLLAVLDLESDGSVTAQGVTVISNRISAVIAEDSTWFQFERAQIPELLKQLSIDESATACSDVQCLTVIGSIIGANYMVGGSIRREGRAISIELNFVDVAAKKALNSVSLQCRSSKKDLLEIEIPALTRELIHPSDRKSRVASKGTKKKSFLKNPFLYIGTGVVGLAAGGAYYYFNYYKEGDGAGESGPNGEISLGDAPARTRGE